MSPEPPGQADLDLGSVRFGAALFFKVSLHIIVHDNKTRIIYSILGGCVLAECVLIPKERCDLLYLTSDLNCSVSWW